MTSVVKPARRPQPGRPVAVLVLLGLVAATALLVFVDWRQIGPPNALVSFEPLVDGRSVTLDGVTDLPDGTLLDWRAYHGELDKPGGISPFRYGDMTAQGGLFDATFMIPEKLPGLLTIEVSFYPEVEQPPATIERFGLKGENLRGSGVVDDSGTPVLVVRRQLNLP
jgi:hypothetical protein